MKNIKYIIGFLLLSVACFGQGSKTVLELPNPCDLTPCEGVQDLTGADTNGDGTIDFLEAEAFAFANGCWGVYEDGKPECEIVCVWCAGPKDVIGDVKSCGEFLQVCRNGNEYTYLDGTPIDSELYISEVSCSNPTYSICVKDGVSSPDLGEYKIAYCDGSVSDDSYFFHSDSFEDLLISIGYQYTKYNAATDEGDTCFFIETNDCISHIVDGGGNAFDINFLSLNTASCEGGCCALIGGKDEDACLVNAQRQYCIEPISYSQYVLTENCTFSQTPPCDLATCPPDHFCDGNGECVPEKTCTCQDIAAATCPNLLDCDGGGIPDCEEIANGGDPSDPSDDTSCEARIQPIPCRDNQGMNEICFDFVDSDGNPVTDGTAAIEISNLDNQLIQSFQFGYGDAGTGYFTGNIENGCVMFDAEQFSIDNNLIGENATPYNICVTITCDGVVSANTDNCQIIPMVYYQVFDNSRANFEASCNELLTNDFLPNQTNAWLGTDVGTISSTDDPNFLVCYETGGCVGGSTFGTTLATINDECGGGITEIGFNGSPLTFATPLPAPNWGSTPNPIVQAVVDNVPEFADCTFGLSHQFFYNGVNFQANVTDCTERQFRYAVIKCCSYDGTLNLIDYIDIEGCTDNTTYGGGGVVRIEVNHAVNLDN